MLFLYTYVISNCYTVCIKKVYVELNLIFWIFLNKF